MLTYFKDFLLNMLIIYLPLVLFPYISKLRERKTLQRFLFYGLFAAEIAVTMSFQIDINGVVHDLRAIPLAIGLFYCGPYVSAALFLTVIGFRIIMESPHIWLYALSMLPAFIVGLLLQAPFRRFQISGRVGITVLYAALVKFLTFTAYFTLTGSLPAMFSSPLTLFDTFVLLILLASGCVGLLEFLKRHHQLQDEVIRSEKMQIVSEMAASVAHEIRNPLTTVRGFIQLFGTADMNPGKKEEYMKLCLDELNRAERIIADYLSLAKPDPDRMEAIELSAELLYLSNVLLTYANYNNIQIEIDTPQEDELFMRGDRFKFRQALINIGKNAIEAMPGGGTLAIRAERRQGGFAVIIRDTGVGMSEEQIRRLGSPYYSTKEKGTGLGTMVSYHIIKKMNGRIDVSSRPGQGTEFCLTFPGA